MFRYQIIIILCGRWKSELLMCYKSPCMAKSGPGDHRSTSSPPFAPLEPYCRREKASRRTKGE